MGIKFLYQLKVRETEDLRGRNSLEIKAPCNLIASAVLAPRDISCETSRLIYKGITTHCRNSLLNREQCFARARARKFLIARADGRNSVVKL